MHVPPTHRDSEMQSVSAMHVVGQAPAPPQRNGEQEGVPAAPFGRIVQVPFALAPFATEQALQPPEQVELQQ